MQTDIGPKNYKFKLIIVIFELLVALCFLYVSIFSNAHSYRGSIGPYLFMAVIFFLLSIMYGLQIIYFPHGVIIDNESDQLIVRYTFLKTKTLSKKDMASYQEVYTKTRSGTKYYGIVLYLKDGKQIFFDEFNLDDYIAVEDYLKRIKIISMGEETSFAFYSYYRNQ